MSNDSLSKPCFLAPQFPFPEAMPYQFLMSSTDARWICRHCVLPRKMKDRATLKSKVPVKAQVSCVMERKKRCYPLRLYSGALSHLLLPKRSEREGLAKSPKMPTNSLSLPAVSACCSSHQKQSLGWVWSCNLVWPIKCSQSVATLVPGLALRRPGHFCFCLLGIQLPCF